PTAPRHAVQDTPRHLLSGSQPVRRTPPSPVAGSRYLRVAGSTHCHAGPDARPGAFRSSAGQRQPTPQRVAPATSIVARGTDLLTDPPINRRAAVIDHQPTISTSPSTARAISSADT